MAETARKFGVTSDVSGLATGIIANSLSFSKNVETAQARNEKGEIIDIAAYSKSEQVSVDGVFVGDGIFISDLIICRCRSASLPQRHPRGS